MIGRAKLWCGEPSARPASGGALAFSNSASGAATGYCESQSPGIVNHVSRARGEESTGFHSAFAATLSSLSPQSRTLA